MSSSLTLWSFKETFNSTSTQQDDPYPLETSKHTSINSTPILFKCNTCKRSIIHTHIIQHTELCRKKKKLANQLEKQSTITKSHSTTHDVQSTPTSIESPSQLPQSHSSSLISLPFTKPKKLSLDLDRQCGVEIEGNTQCSRAITCKIHSINAKRGVLRSQAYDLLHQIYQAKQSKSIHFSQKLNSSSIGVKDGSVIGLGLGLESLERIDDKVFQENLKRRYVAGEVCLSGTGIFVTGVGSGMHVHVATLDWKKFQAKKRLRCSLMALYATKD